MRRIYLSGRDFDREAEESGFPNFGAWPWVSRVVPLFWIHQTQTSLRDREHSRLVPPGSKFEGHEFVCRYIARRADFDWFMTMWHELDRLADQAMKQSRALMLDRLDLADEKACGVHERFVEDLQSMADAIVRRWTNVSASGACCYDQVPDRGESAVRAVRGLLEHAQGMDMTLEWARRMAGVRPYSFMANYLDHVWCMANMHGPKRNLAGGLQYDF